MDVHVRKIYLHMDVQIVYLLMDVHVQKIHFYMNVCVQKECTGYILTNECACTDCIVTKG